MCSSKRDALVETDVEPMYALYCVWMGRSVSVPQRTLGAELLPAAGALCVWEL